MTEYIDKALIDRPTGLSFHYPFLHAAVVGMGARTTLEFGAGGSTRVFLDALPPDGLHLSFSTETLAEVVGRYRPPVLIDENGRAAFVSRLGAEPGPRWLHHCGKSESFRGLALAPLDLILHDGSHAADVVAADIAWAWPRLKRFGLLLVHDSQHSYCGAEVRKGIKQALAPFSHEYTMTTLPYGFGLTVVRREEGGPGVIEPAIAKPGSQHVTQPVRVE